MYGKPEIQHLQVIQTMQDELYILFDITQQYYYHCDSESFLPNILGGVLLGLERKEKDQPPSDFDPEYVFVCASVGDCSKSYLFA